MNIEQHFHSLQQCLNKGDLNQANYLFKEISFDKIENQHSYLYQYGLIALYLNKLDQAEKYISQAIHINENQPIYYNGLGNVFMSQGKIDHAQGAFEKGLVHNPQSEMLLVNLAGVFMYRRDYDQAYQTYQKILTFNDQSYAAYVGLASIEERRLHNEKSIRYARQALEVQPKGTEARVILSIVLRREKKASEALQEIEVLLKDESDHTMALFEKGHNLNALERYNDAIETFKIAKAKSNPKKQTRDSFLDYYQKHVQTLEQIKQRFKPENARVSRQYPICIVGSLRTGSTLVSQILHAHSQVHDEGEIPLVPQWIHHFKKQTGLSLFDLTLCVWDNANTDLIVQMRQAYEEKVACLESHKKGLWSVDKHLSNAWHLGVLSQIAQGAPVIQVIRDGREVALSCLMQNFRDYQWHTYSLEDALCDWEHTIKYVRQAHEVFKFPYLELRYEEIVQNPEAESKRLIEFLGLEWEEACLDFYKTQNDIKTASYDQVKQKIYTSSVSRRERYPEVYEEMNRVAGEALQEMGYTLNP